MIFCDSVKKPLSEYFISKKRQLGGNAKIELYSIKQEKWVNSVIPFDDVIRNIENGCAHIYRIQPVN